MIRGHPFLENPLATLPSSRCLGRIGNWEGNFRSLGPCTQHAVEHVSNWVCDWPHGIWEQAGEGEVITVGIVSNAEYRYKEVILPALGLNQGSEWDFGVFSGIVGVEKPDPKIYKIALEMAGNVAPEEALHIGDSYRKDYVPARSIGMHALLLDRFKTADAESWRKSGAPVLPDLEATKAWLAKNPTEEPAEEPLGAALLRRMAEKL